MMCSQGDLTLSLVIMPCTLMQGCCEGKVDLMSLREENGVHAVCNEQHDVKLTLQHGSIESECCFMAQFGKGTLQGHITSNSSF